MSIRTKFTLFTFFAMVLLTGGILTSIFFTQTTLLKKQFEDNQHKLFKDFTTTCYEAVIVKDEILIFNTMKSLIETYKPQIIYSGYISATDMKLLVTLNKEKEQQLLQRITHVKGTTIENFILNGDEIKEFAAELKDKEGSYAGTIKVGFSSTYLKQQIDEAVLLTAKRIINIAIVAIIIALILSNILVALLVKPIKVLTDAAIKVGSGNLDVQTGIKGKDEVGILGKTFDEMVQKVKQLDELKDSFVSSVSHELRSPLSAIDGYIDYLVELLNSGSEVPAEKQLKALNIMKDATKRLTTFINNILDLAKIKAGKFELNKIPVQPEEIILEVVSLFEQMALRQNKTILSSVPKELPLIYADPERIKEVITNFIGNALKFTDPNATITVTARVVAEQTLTKGYKHPVANAANNYVEISVIDTGWGIPENELDKIFDKFYQVGGTTPKKPKGTGLGLAIAYEIVKLHGGEIGVESQVGKGSTFKFVIPIYKTKV
ncbi:MAG: HAMP domain-containing histidine kinase [Endomicrobia bacterium]|nr:HAMP domain-containing histidine kinase [Endomicrobiia bacterium]MDW8056241.1 HAMP domain-containing sensor histidine kinase [Elusimicrobiota bacterium]